MRNPLPLIVIGVVVLIVLVGGGFLVSNYLSGSAVKAKADEYAAVVRAGGYDVTYEGVETTDDGGMAFTNAVLSDTASGWKLSAPRVLVTGADTAQVALQMTGEQQLQYKAGGQDHTAAVKSDSTQVNLQRDSAGRVTQAVADITGLAITEGDAAPVTAKHLRLQLTRGAGADAVPDGSTLAVDVEEGKVPAWSTGPLGDTIASLSTELAIQKGLPSLHLVEALHAWQAADGAANVTKLATRWGLLNMEGTGTLKLDAEGRPAGSLQAKVTDYFGLIDAFHAVQHFDAALRATWYAVLLDEAGEANSNVGDFAVDIADGKVTATHPGTDLGALTLASVPSLTGGPGS